MKKFIFLFSVVLLASCSLLPEMGAKNTALIDAEKKAKDEITKHADLVVKSAEKSIDSLVVATMGNIKSDLSSISQTLQKSFDDKVSKAETSLNTKFEDHNKSIKESVIIGSIGIALGLIGLIAIVFIYRKLSRKLMSSGKVRKIFSEEITRPDNNQLRQEIIRILNEEQKKYEQKIPIKDIVSALVDNRRFNELIATKTAASTPNNVANINNAKPNPVEQIDAPLEYYFYARESNSMTLNNLQDTYQIGKSIYHLTMKEPNATTAELSICMEDDAKRRIINFEGESLKPICNVTNTTCNPTNIIVISKGLAERNGNVWIVTRKVDVEIR